MTAHPLYYPRSSPTLQTHSRARPRCTTRQGRSGAAAQLRRAAPPRSPAAQITVGRVSEDTSRSGPANASLSRRRPSAPRSVMTLSSVSVSSLMLTSSTSVSGAPGTLSGTPAPHGSDLVGAARLAPCCRRRPCAAQIGTDSFYGREVRERTLINAHAWGPSQLESVCAHLVRLLPFT